MTIIVTNNDCTLKIRFVSDIIANEHVVTYKVELMLVRQLDMTFSPRAAQSKT